MKKRLVWLLTGVMLFSVAGCGKKDPNKVTTKEGVVTLGEYKGLSAVKTLYSVTEEEIQEEIDNILGEFADYEEVKRESQIGDSLSVKGTVTEGDTMLLDASSAPEQIVIGYEQYGEEVDKRLTGVKAGKKLVFKVTYAEDDEIAEWPGKTVLWDITVEQVLEEKVPTPTDEFVKENLGYESYEDMKTHIKEYLEEENKTNSDLEVDEDLIQQVIDKSTVDKASDELKEKCKKAVENNYMQYAAMYGFETTKEFYDAMGIEESAITELENTLVTRSLVVAAIAKKEKIKVSEEDYKEAIDRYVTMYQYESTDELLKSYDEATIKEWVLEEKVFDLIKKNATITEENASEEESIEEDSSEDDENEEELAEENK